jgi:hypothetical protein
MTGRTWDFRKDSSNLVAFHLLMAFRLPFLLHNDCVLGLAVSTYFSEIIGAANPSSDAKDAALERGSHLLMFATDYEGDIGKAFKLWDAVCDTWSFP